MQLQVLILGVNYINFTSKETGELIKGWKIHYSDCGSLSTTNFDVNSKNSGANLSSQWVSVSESSCLNTITDLPAYYDAEIQINKGKIKLVSFSNPQLLKVPGSSSSFLSKVA